MEHLVTDLCNALKASRINRLRPKKHHFKRRSRFTTHSMRKDSTVKTSDYDSSSTNSLDQTWRGTSMETFRHPSLLNHSDSDEIPFFNQRHKLLLSISRSSRIKRLQKSCATPMRESLMLQKIRRRKRMRHFYSANLNDYRNLVSSNGYFRRYKRHHFHSQSNFQLNRTSNLPQDFDDRMTIASESSESNTWSASEGGGHDGDDELTDNAPTHDTLSGSELNSSSFEMSTPNFILFPCRRIHMAKLSMNVTPQQKKLTSEIITAFLNDDHQMEFEFCSNCSIKLADFIRKHWINIKCRRVDLKMNEFNSNIKLVKIFPKFSSILSPSELNKLRFKN